MWSHANHWKGGYTRPRFVFGNEACNLTLAQRRQAIATNILLQIPKKKSPKSKRYSTVRFYKFRKIGRP